MTQRGRMFAWAGESQYYVEPKRLAGLGYLEARKEPGKTRERTVYSLTAKGRRALREYAKTPVTFTPLKSDPLQRLLIADLVGEEVTRESLQTLREDLDDLRARRLGPDEKWEDPDKPNPAKVNKAAMKALEILVLELAERPDPAQSTTARIGRLAKHLRGQ